MIRLGLIGAGPWGQRYIQTLQGFEGAVLAAAASRNPRTASLVPADCRVLADWTSLLALDDLDGVIIATPPSLHAEMTAAAIEAGLPVLVEKPLTMDLAQAKKLLSLARRREALVIVGHLHLFSAAYAALRKKAQELGRLKSVRTLGGGAGPYREDVPPLWDYAPHDVAFCLDLIGEKPVSAAGRLEETAAAGRENLRLALGFRGGISAEISVGNFFPQKRRLFEARYEGGTLTIDDTKEEKLVLRPPSGPTRPLPVSSGMPLERLLRAFCAAIASDLRDLSSLRLGVAVVDVLSEIEHGLRR